MSLFPLFVELAGKRVVVVGGGKVGQRKAAAVVLAGGLVRIVDPALAPSADVVSEPYSARHIADAQLVFACATPEVNARVVSDAKICGIWVNAASDPDAGDIILPAVVKRGDLTIAVSTGGASPALSRRIREKLEAVFDESFAAWVELFAEVRPVVLEAISDPERRRVLLDGFADWPWLERIRNEGVEAVRARIMALVTRAEGAENTEHQN